MIELGLVSRAIAFGEGEGEWTSNLAHFAELADLLDVDVVNPRGATRAEQLHSLVITVTRAPAVADQAKSASPAPQDELRRVDVA